MNMLVWAIGKKRFNRWLERAAQVILDAVSENIDAPQEELLSGISSALRKLMTELRVREHA